VFRLALQQPALDDAIFDNVKGNLLMTNPLATIVELSRLFSRIVAKYAMQPLDMDRIEDVFSGLHPVTGGHRLSYFAPYVFFNQQVPARHQRRRLRTQVCEDQSAQ